MNDKFFYLVDRLKQINVDGKDIANSMNWNSSKFYKFKKAFFEGKNPSSLKKEDIISFTNFVNEKLGDKHNEIDMAWWYSKKIIPLKLKVKGMPTIIHKVKISRLEYVHKIICNKMDIDKICEHLGYTKSEINKYAKKNQPKKLIAYYVDFHNVSLSYLYGFSNEPFRK